VFNYQHKRLSNASVAGQADSDIIMWHVLNYIRVVCVDCDAPSAQHINLTLHSMTPVNNQTHN